LSPPHRGESEADRNRTLHRTAWAALSKACNYTLTLWPKLARFLEYPELELSRKGNFRNSSSHGGKATASESP
jgi:hypothetical protein